MLTFLYFELKQYVEDFLSLHDCIRDQTDKCNNTVYTLALLLLRK
jgi:hypothetical protein